MSEQNTSNQSELPIFATEDSEKEKFDSNAEMAKRIAETAKQREGKPWDNRISVAASEQSGIPEDLEVNPIPIELQFLSKEDLHDAVISRPEVLVGKPLGAIKKLASTAHRHLTESKEKYELSREANPNSEATELAGKQLEFWKNHYDRLMDNPRIRTAILGDDR